MKISNKKRAIKHIIFQIMIILLLLGAIILFRNIDYHLLFMLSVVACLLVLLYGKIKNRFIFEYENLDEIISIKSYQWPSLGKNPRFEIPHGKILNIEIKKEFLQKYLIILFSDYSGNVVRVDINITFCSEIQVHLLFRDITKNMKMQDDEYISTKKQPYCEQ